MSTLLSDPPGGSLSVTTVAGSISVTGGGGGGQNTLSVGTGSGASGTPVTVPLNLDNQDVVKGLQTDIQFNAAVVQYQSIAATARVGTMSVSASVVEGNKVRVVAVYMNADTLVAGTGAIANLTFQLIGAGGTQTALTPMSTLLSDPPGGSLSVTTVAGSISVTGGGQQNTLSVGSGSGNSGTEITVAVSLNNQSIVKALQTDIRFDPAVVSFLRGNATGLAATMTFGANAVAGDTVRVVMYYGATPEVLNPGSGAIANLVFRAVGAGGTQTALTPSDTELSEPGGQALPVTTQAGSIQVTSTAPPPPVLKIAVLKNPARTRTLQLFVTSDQDLVAVPDVTLEGTTVAMTPVPQVTRAWQGAASVELDSPFAVVQATGSNGSQPGTASVTVTF
jgi:hypothetical protein